MKITHNGTDINYDEPSNTWKFVLRARDRSVESLAKAKEAIDKPVAEKSKPFEKIPAWEFRNDVPAKVEITGWTDQYGSPAAWITCPKDGRRKERIEFRLYPSTPENDSSVEQIIAKCAEVARLNDEIRRLKYKLAKLEVPKE